MGMERVEERKEERKRGKKRKKRKGIDLGQRYVEFINNVGLYVKHIHSMPEMLHLQFV